MQIYKSRQKKETSTLGTLEVDTWNITYNKDNNIHETGGEKENKFKKFIN